ncbi:MAG: metal ABC transporter ATP-binding protein [Promethearchaeota archaeon]
MEPIISLKDVGVKYQSIIALHDVNLEIYQGDYIGIFGPNGSGKTTLLKTILGFIKPFKGSVKLFNSKDLKKMRINIGYVPQNFTVSKSFPATVLEVVKMGLYGKVGFLKPLKEEHEEFAEKALHDVHMGNYKNRPIGHLSGGEMQKVMVARALVSKPKTLLLDEPTNALDFIMTKDLMELLSELNKKFNITIIGVNHHLDLLIPYCSRLLLMDRSIMYDGVPKNPKVNEVINQIFNISIQT